ncbi:MAG: TolC family protein, partial [Desulfamplus sp.]
HEESIRLKEALSLAKEAEHLLEIRYRSGATSMQSWLDSQESRRAAEISLAQNRLNRLTNMMKLYQSLGGGCKSVE